MSRRLFWVRRLGLLCVSLTVVLMTVGAWVKATGSGLSCPDWPACYGEWLPPFPSIESEGQVPGIQGPGEDPAEGYTHNQVLYEWAHRALVSLIGIPVIALAILAWRGRSFRPALRWIPVAAVAVLGLQALLGRLTVVTGNPAWATTLHMAVAVLWFAMLLVATCIAFLAPSVASTPVQVRAQSPHPAFAPSGAPVRFVYPGEDREEPDGR